MDLSKHSASIGDIAKVKLTIASESYALSDPAVQLSASGAPYRGDSDSWYLNVSNDGSQALSTSGSQYMLLDAKSRLFLWSYPLCYVDGNLVTTLAAGGKGCLESKDLTPDYLGAKLNLSATLLGWRLPLSKDLESSRSLGAYSSDDERNGAMLAAANAATAAMSEAAKAAAAR